MSTTTAADALRKRGDLERVAVSSLVPFPGNARKGDVPAIRRSLKRFGQFAPLVVQASTSYVLAGNHTHEAARLEGWDEIDAYVIDVDDAEALAINVAANKLPELGGFDEDALIAQLEELRDLDLDLLEVSGITDEELEDLIVAHEPEAEIAPPAPVGTPAAGETTRQPSGDPDEVEDSYGAPTADSDRREKFDPNGERRNAARRLMVFDLPVDVFVWLSEQLEEICEARGIETNTEAVLELVAEDRGISAPRLVDGEAEGEDDRG